MTKFAFGRNWRDFLATVDDARLAVARQSMEHLLNVSSLAGKRFLDAGSGSGLFSAAANRLDASVVSFDVDDDSVACTTELRSRFATSTSDWRIEQGSLLDADYLRSLGPFDVVYCWGVAHHTGAMWTALENLSRIVAPHGLLVIAIYNDQEYLSKAWTMVKSVYQRLPRFLRPPYVAAIGLYGFLQRFATTLMACCLRLVTFRNPLVPIINWLRQPQQRGMHVWYDLVDWVGGWPYEVAKPEALFRFFRDRGFELREMTTCSGHGCNEFVFCRKSP